MIASDRNLVCHYELVTRNYARLGGSKELITLAGHPQWETNREFNEMYSQHVIHWFDLNGADVRARALAADEALTTTNSANGDE